MAHEGQTIHNPRTGQRITFTSLAPEELRFDSAMAPGAGREALHVHPRQESGVEVSGGSLVVEIDGVRHDVPAGERIAIPRRTPHRFWNDGDVDAEFVAWFRPALDTAAFFETWCALARDGDLGPEGMPGLLQLSLLVPEFGAEVRPASPPWPLLRVLGAVLGPVARLRGLRARRT
jgi:mannose-6-phosphate isomerase-like protein (cupin superfamily)